MARPKGIPMSQEQKDLRSKLFTGRKKSEETKQKMRERAIRDNCIKAVQTPEAREKQRQYMLNEYDHSWKIGLKQSEETKRKHSESMKGIVRTAEHNAKLGLARVGEKSHFWRGGIAAINAEIRAQAMQTAEYRAWRRAVLKRDNKTCQMADETCEGHLHVDHIKSWKNFPELRLDVSNGRVLCAHHHKQTDNYAGRVMKEQVETDTKE